MPLNFFVLFREKNLVPETLLQLKFYSFQLIELQNI